MSHDDRTRDDSAPTTAPLLEAQRNVLEMIVRGRPLVETLDALCRIVEDEARDTVRASILLLDESGRRLFTAAAPSLPATYTAAIDGIAIDPDVGTCAAAAARRELVVTRDIAGDPAWAALAHLPLALGLKAAWSVPIVSSHGGVLGTIGTYVADRRGPRPDERRLVEVLAHTASLAIERARSDRALLDSEARYRTIVEASPECVKVVAADGRLLQMNAAGLRMIEASCEDDVRGANVYDLIAPEHRESFRDFNARICGGDSGTLAFDIVGQRGTRRSMETTAVPLPMPGGGYAQLALTRDVTAREAASRALEESRTRLHYAMRLSGGVGFWWCDLPLDELVWDERVKQHFFLPPDARVRIADFFDRLHPDDREPTRQAIDASIHHRRSYDVVYRTVCPTSGRTKWIRALGGAVYDTAGTPTHFDGVTVDITAQKRNEERLATLNQQLREHDRRKDEFLATLAHELRNPLAPIRTGLHVLRGVTDPDQAARLQDMMERQLGHLVRMVDDLLDISRVTLGKVRLRTARVDLRDIVHSALETTRPLIEAGRHELAVELPQAPLPLDADATRLAQVLANLLNNAARYTPPGGRIRLVVNSPGPAEVTVSVTDTGVGIPAEMLPIIFDMFTQIDRPDIGDSGGLGLGLTLVRRLVEMHGGSVTAESAGTGSGSTFIVRLPVATTPDDAEPVPPSPVRAADAILRVLVVDDNTDGADSLGMLLRLWGHDVRVAHRGHEAIALAPICEPDVVILDIGLPDVDGYAVARHLRALPACGDRVVLAALTGWGSDEDRRRATDAGFDRHLVKPVDVAALTDVLALAVSRRFPTLRQGA